MEKTRWEILIQRKYKESIVLFFDELRIRYTLSDEGSDMLWVIAYADNDAKLLFKLKFGGFELPPFGVEIKL